MKTGNTARVACWIRGARPPQWSPVMKTGNTPAPGQLDAAAPVASMEPGHEDREYVGRLLAEDPQVAASMEPGHEDREYPGPVRVPLAQVLASMEPGHEDREYF